MWSKVTSSETLYGALSFFHKLLSLKQVTFEKKKLIEIQIQIPTITWLLTKRFDLGIFTLKFYRFVSKA